jgi:hypothetical protein
VREVEIEQIEVGNPEANEIATKVRTWLREEKCLESRESDTSHYVAFKCKFPLSGNRFYAILPRDKDVVLLLAVVGFGEDNKQFFQNLLLTDEHLASNLYLALLEIGCQFQFVDKSGAAVPPEGDFERITLQVFVYYDGVSKDNLMNAVDKVERSIMAILWLMKKHNIPIRTKSLTGTYS